VTIAPKQVMASEITSELKPIVRKAGPEDVKRAQDFTAKEDNALTECAKMIARLKLPMKLVSAEYNLDGSRLTFYFTADERVDFRELVRELTAFFKTRIELRQIGPRDQAKLVGGLGRCGRPLCCGSFLTEFSPVSIKMAKEQDLPLDPMKISGVCGRLQCCLAYESAQYHEAKAQMPRKGQQVNTPEGVGFVISVFPLKDTVLVEMESKADVEFPVSQIQVIKEAARPAPAEPEPAENEGIETPPVAESPAKPVAPAPAQAAKEQAATAQPEAEAVTPQQSSSALSQPVEVQPPTESNEASLEASNSEPPAVVQDVKKEPEPPRQDAPPA
jgi:cell fate regulator YaaT (PSP1 superfamily)